MARVLLNVPKTAMAGSSVPVKLLISHPMESGQRHDESGALVQRMIIHELRCAYGGDEVLHLNLFPAIAANPYFEFSFRARASGTVEISWLDDDGVAGFIRREIEVV